VSSRGTAAAVGLALAGGAGQRGGATAGPDCGGAPRLRDVIEASFKGSPRASRVTRGTGNCRGACARSFYDPHSRPRALVKVAPVDRHWNRTWVCGRRRIFQHASGAVRAFQSPCESDGVALCAGVRRGPAQLAVPQLWPNKGHMAPTPRGARSIRSQDECLRGRVLVEGRVKSPITVQVGPVVENCAGGESNATHTLGNVESQVSPTRCTGGGQSAQVPPTHLKAPTYKAPPGPTNRAMAHGTVRQRRRLLRKT